MTGGLASSAPARGTRREMKWALLSLFPDCWVVSARRTPPWGRLPAAALYATKICACFTALAVRTITLWGERWAVALRRTGDVSRPTGQAAWDLTHTG